MRLILFICGLVLFGCEPSTDNSQINLEAPSATTQEVTGPRNVILFLGDSLTAGFQLPAHDAYPALIGQKLQEANKDYRIRNAAVSGYTSKNVLDNLSWSLTDDVAFAFLCVGGNDGLRGYKAETLAQNLEQIIHQLQKKQVTVILAGMQIPTNYGPQYTKRFMEVYPQVAKKLQVKYMPFLLKGVAGKVEYNLADAIHPDAKGHKVIAANVWDFLEQENILP